MFKFWSVYRLWNGRPTIGYNGLGIAEGGDFFAQNFNRNTAVQILQKS
jgi:hypothetical protein